MLEVVLYLLTLGIVSWGLGWYMHWVLDRELRLPCEALCLRLMGVDPGLQMDWKEYARALLLFNTLGLLVLFVILRIQFYLPWNPFSLPGLEPGLALNTACSFATNTNWQSYAGEVSMSWATQMWGLTTQNFLSAATGMVALMALCRGIRQQENRNLGNFWVDLTRCLLGILLPLSCLMALFLVWQGVPQTLHQPAPQTTLEGRTQVIPLGPVASQVAIKQLGTNGGGFYGVNSAHPLENPTPLSNFVQCLAILLIPAALCHTYGRALGDKRQGLAILASMTLLFLPLLGICIDSERHNMEGKEVRFGTVASSLWCAATTAASNGSVNSMHDSYTAVGGLVPISLMLTGEVVFGGVGCGVYGFFLYVLVAVFVSGLMVGRTPEYQGKKVEAFEIKLTALGILLMPMLVLVFASGAVLWPPAAQAVNNSGPHGFSEVLYACASMGNNNGSAFAGLSTDQPYYNWIGGVVMFLSRFGTVVPVLAIAGSLANKKRIPSSSGTLPTHSPLFVIWVAAIIVGIGALSFLPVLVLGPGAEALL